MSALKDAEYASSLKNHDEPLFVETAAKRLKRPVLSKVGLACDFSRLANASMPAMKPASTLWARKPPPSRVRIGPPSAVARPARLARVMGVWR